MSSSPGTPASSQLSPGTGAAGSGGPKTDALPALPRYAAWANTGGILVTGSHRSGTTWVGRMLAAAPKVDYIHEPFKPGWTLPTTFTRSELWFPYIAEHNEASWRRDVLKTLRFGYSWSYTYGEDPGLKQAWKATDRWFRWRSRRLRGNRPLIKDPIALYAAPWMSDRFGVDVVVMIRHPAAFVSSIKLKNWVFDWSHWTDQKELMSSLLAPFAEEIERKQRDKADIIDQAVLQWRIFHHVIDVYRQRRPDWLFVRHEDLSLDPVKGFKQMYAHCKLQWTPQAEELIRTSSDEGNLKDANAAGKSTHYVKLDSAGNIKNWKKRLSPEEISRIRTGCADLSSRFYSDEDWE